MKYIAKISRSAELGRADQYEVSKVTPNGKGRSYWWYATINRKNTKQHLSCWVKVNNELRNELAGGYWPGGIHVKLIETNSGEWIVMFCAEDALIDMSARLPGEEMKKLLDSINI